MTIKEFMNNEKEVKINWIGSLTILGMGFFLFYLIPLLQVMNEGMMYL